MTEQTEQAQIVVREKADAPTEWGERKDIVALGHRLKAMMPGNLSAQEALLLAQYSSAMDANPFRGEVYAYQSGGKLILTEGYKLLVRWARRQSQFYERYERITNDTDTISEDAIAFRCRILRQDAVHDLAELTLAGVPSAYEICSIEAVGVVDQKETWSTRYNKPIAPPKGWTWEDVARKRALKNALNRAYGAPSPREIAQETWMVDDVETIPEDWEHTTLPTEAKFNAGQRLRQTLDESAEESVDILFGDEPGESPEPGSAPAPAPAEDVVQPAMAVGLVDLMEDVNVELGLRGFGPHYKHAIHIKNALQQLGYTGYKPSKHKEYVARLVARVEAKEINEAEEDIPF